MAYDPIDNFTITALEEDPVEGFTITSLQEKQPAGDVEAEPEKSTWDKVVDYSVEKLNPLYVYKEPLKRILPEEYAKRLDVDAAQKLADYVQEGAKELEKQYPKGGIGQRYYSWVANDFSNIPRFLSPEDFQEFIKETLKNPKETARGIAKQFGTIEGWKTTPLTNVVMALGAGKGAKKLGRKAAGLEPLIKMPGEPVVPREPVAPYEPGITGAEGTVPLRRQYPVEWGGEAQFKSDLPIYEKAPPMPEEGITYGRGKMGEVVPESSLTERITPEIRKGYRFGEEPVGEMPQTPRPEAYMETGDIAFEPTATGRGYVPDTGRRPPRVEPMPAYPEAEAYLRRPEGTIEPVTPRVPLEWEINEMGEGFKKAGVIPEDAPWSNEWKELHGGPPAEWFIKPVKSLYDWYINTPMEVRQARWQDFQNRFKEPIPKSWYENGHISYDTWKKLEKGRYISRVALTEKGQLNPAYLQKVLDANPDMYYEMVVAPNIARNKMQGMVTELATAMDSAPDSIKQRLGEFASSGMSKQEFAEILGRDLGELPAKQAKIALDKIAEWGNELEKKGMLTPESRAQWEDPHYLHRAYVKHQSLGDIKRTLDEKIAPGVGDLVERVRKKNITPEIKNLEGMSGPELELALTKYDLQTAADIRYMANNNLIPTMEIVDSIMKHTSSVNKALGRIGIGRGLKMNQDILRQRGIKKEVSGRNLSEWKDKGYTAKEETFSGEFMIEKGGKRKVVSGDSIDKWTEKGWNIEKITKQKRYEVWRDFTPQERSVMGEIKEIDYKIADSLVRMNNIITNSKVFDVISDPKNNMSIANPQELSARIAKMDRTIKSLGENAPSEMIRQKKVLEDVFAKNQEQIENARAYGVDYKDIPNDRSKYGSLAGKYVPDFMHDYITGTMQGVNRFAESIPRKYYQLWKKSKTIWNPATHVRNFMFNAVLADLAGVDPFNPKDWKYYKIAKNELLKEYRKPGSSQFVKDINETGVDIFRSGFGKEFGDYLSAFDKKLIEARGATAMEQMYSGTESFWNKTAGKADKTLTAAYAGSESLFKAAIISKKVANGMSYADAARVANKYLFDYGNVSPAVDFLRRTPVVGSPFVTFYAKLTPLMAETLAVQPWKVIKWYAISEAFNEAGRAYYGLSREEADIINEARPDWYKNEPLRRKTAFAPFADVLGSEEDRVYSYDIGSVNPLADWMNIAKSLMPVVNDPVFNTVTTQLSRKTLFNDKEVIDKGAFWKMPYARQRASWMWSQAAPTPAILSGGYQAGGKLYKAGQQALTGQTTSEWWGGTRSPALLILDGLFGQKIRPEMTEEALDSSIRYNTYTANRIESEINRIEGGGVKKYTMTDGSISREGKKRISDLELQKQQYQDDLDASNMLRSEYGKLRSRRQ